MEELDKNYTYIRFRPMSTIFESVPTNQAIRAGFRRSFGVSFGRKEDETVISAYTLRLHSRSKYGFMLGNGHG